MQDQQCSEKELPNHHGDDEGSPTTTTTRHTNNSTSLLVQQDMIVPPPPPPPPRNSIYMSTTSPEDLIAKHKGRRQARRSKEMAAFVQDPGTSARWTNENKELLASSSPAFVSPPPSSTCAVDQNQDEMKPSNGQPEKEEFGSTISSSSNGVTPTSRKSLRQTPSPRRSAKELKKAKRLSEEAIAKSRGRVFSSPVSHEHEEEINSRGAALRQESNGRRSAGSSSSTRTSERRLRKSVPRRSKEELPTTTTTTGGTSRSSSSYRSSVQLQGSEDIEEGQHLNDYSSSEEGEDSVIYPGATQIRGGIMEGGSTSRRSLNLLRSSPELVPAPLILEAVMVQDEPSQEIVTATIVHEDNRTAKTHQETDAMPPAVPPERKQNGWDCTRCTWAFCGVSGTCLVCCLVVIVAVGTIFLSQIDPETLEALAELDDDAP